MLKMIGSFAWYKEEYVSKIMEGFDFFKQKYSLNTKFPHSHPLTH